jgi:hypothetical protein
MSNLVPEPRQDKNGKIVVRHVKVEVGGHTINVPIPAPHPVASTQPKVDPVEALCADLSYAIMEATMDFDSLSDDAEGENDLAREGIYSHLKTFPPELVTVLNDLRVNDNSLFNELARRVEQREPARFVSNIISYVRTYGGDWDQQTSFVRSLDYYTELNQNDDVFAEGSVEDSKVKAILAVASAIYRHADHGNEDADQAMRWEPHDFDFLPSPVIGSEELTNYVLENYERGSDIAKIIKERKVFTLDEIKIVMDHPETSLSGGVL